jgi:hypothetical protein
MVCTPCLFLNCFFIWAILVGGVSFSYIVKWHALQIDGVFVFIAILFMSPLLWLYDRIVKWACQRLNVTKLRYFWLLLPSLVFFAWATKSFYFQKNPFVPAGATDIKSYSDRRGFDSTRAAYFKTNSQEVDRLVKKLNLGKGKLVFGDGRQVFIDTAKEEKISRRSQEAIALEKRENWPDYLQWEKPMCYKRIDSGGFYCLYTDASRSQVYLIYGDF